MFCNSLATIQKKETFKNRHCTKCVLVKICPTRRLRKFIRGSSFRDKFKNSEPNKICSLISKNNYLLKLGIETIYINMFFLFQKIGYDTTAKSSLYLKIFWLKIEDASELVGYKCPCRGCAGAATSHW